MKGICNMIGSGSWRRRLLAARRRSAGVASVAAELVTKRRIDGGRRLAGKKYSWLHIVVCVSVLHRICAKPKSLSNENSQQRKRESEKTAEGGAWAGENEISGGEKLRESAS